MKINELAQTASSMDLKDLAKALRGEKKQAVKAPVKAEAAEEQSAQDLQALPKQAARLKGSTGSDLAVSSGKSMPVDDSKMVMLCFSTGELDESVLATLKTIGEAASARVLLSSEMGFHLFNPKGRSLVLEGKRSALHTDYLKFGVGYIQELYEKLSQEFDSEELIADLLFEQFDRKWKARKHGVSELELHQILEGSCFVQDAQKLPLPTFNLDFEAYEAQRGEASRERVHPNFDKARQTWKIQGSPQDVEFELQGADSAQRFLPGKADTRVSVLRLFTAATCQPDKNYSRLVDGFVFVFRWRQDVEKLIQRYNTILEETLKAEINERRVTLQIDLPAEQVSTFTFVSDQNSFLHFLDNWK
eukprot:516262-Rhodomonas_salina.2